MCDVVLAGGDLAKKGAVTAGVVVHNAGGIRRTLTGRGNGTGDGGGLRQGGGAVESGTNCRRARESSGARECRRDAVDGHHSA